MSNWLNVANRWVDNADDSLDVIPRKVLIEMCSRIIIRTPVDEGRARGNWQPAIGAPPEGAIAINDKTGEATISKATAQALKVKAGDVFVLANNLPYIKRLEEGHSKRAPDGMVALTVQEFQYIFKRMEAGHG